MHEETQQRQIRHDRYDQSRLLFSGPWFSFRQNGYGATLGFGPVEILHNIETAAIIDQRRQKKQQNKKRIGPSVKDITQQRQYGMTRPAPYGIIDTQRNRQKPEQKQMTAENHDSHPIAKPKSHLRRCATRFQSGSPYKRAQPFRTIPSQDSTTKPS